MADAVIQIPPDGTGKLIDAAQVTVGGQGVYRQKFVIADAQSNNYLSISNSGAIPLALSQISASDETSTIYTGTTPLTPQFSTIVASASGATTIVNAVASKRIRVVALQVIANASVNLKWQSHVSPTDITGLAYLAANGGYVLPYNPVGWFQTVAGEALDINLSGSVAVGGSLTYVAV
jgi:hypothetical protein